MGKLPKFKCVECKKNIDVGEVCIFPLGGTSIDIEGFPITDEKRLCKKCYDGYIQEKKEDETTPLSNATEKQKAFLIRLGFDGDTEKLTKVEASKIISKLLGKRKNGKMA